MGSCISKPQEEREQLHLPGSTVRKNSKSSSKDAIKLQQQQPPQKVPLDLGQFELRRVIGRGTFGKVKVVVHKSTGKTYALKYISKVACVARQAAVNVIRERKIMEVLHHPLVCNLRYAFQDVDYLYLVSDLMLGGDLRFHLLRKTFTEDAIRMWIAETVAALSYCHSRGIVHRDVKPDNILLTAEGHCKLADFNISTQIRGTNMPRTRSGSLFYMAPEIHEGLPYDFAIDYWSLGVVFFEAIYGHRPFFGKSSNEVSASIRQCEAPLPVCTPPVSAPCEAAIRALLTANPNMRSHTQQDVAALEFFSSLNWPQVARGQAQPVFLPGADKNFDAAWELEEILLHDSPLEPRRQATKKKLVPENAAAAEVFELMEHPSNLISDSALTSGVPDTTTTDGFVDMDEKRLSTAAAQSKEASTMSPDSSSVAAAGEGSVSKERPGQSSSSSATGFFKSKPKKPVVVPPGVLALKAGGRLKVAAPAPAAATT